MVVPSALPYDLPSPVNCTEHHCRGTFILYAASTKTFYLTAKIGCLGKIGCPKKEDFKPGSAQEPCPIAKTFCVSHFSHAVTNYLTEPLVEERVCSGSQVEGHHSGAGVTAGPVTVTGRKDGRGWQCSACLLFSYSVTDPRL